jgi:hypothetical protein
MLEDIKKTSARTLKPANYNLIIDFRLGQLGQLSHNCLEVYKKCDILM